MVSINDDRLCSVLGVAAKRVVLRTLQCNVGVMFDFDLLVIRSLVGNNIFDLGPKERLKAFQTLHRIETKRHKLKEGLTKL